MADASSSLRSASKEKLSKNAFRKDAAFSKKPEMSTSGWSRLKRRIVMEMIARSNLITIVAFGKDIYGRFFCFKAHVPTIHNFKAFFVVYFFLRSREDHLPVMQKHRCYQTASQLPELPEQYVSTTSRAIKLEKFPQNDFSKCTTM